MSLDFNSNQEGHIAPEAIVATSSTDTAATVTNDEPAPRAKELLGIYHSMSNAMNFKMANELALDCVDEVLEHWLPDGETQGAEYVVCNPTRDDNNAGSFKINTETGLWADFSAGDKGGDLISLVAYVTEAESQVDAAVAILEFIAGMNTDDAAPIKQRSVIRKAKEKAKSDFTIVMPIPDEALAKRPLFFGRELGSPAATWEYRDTTGQVMFYVHRFNTKDGKSFLPQTYWKDSTGWPIWKTWAPLEPRPAYGLQKLAVRPDAPVLFTEGEKSADAAQRLFPGYVAVTTMNGAQSPQKTDFKPFAGRKVYIAPDNDEAGTKYKDKLIELLRNVGAEVVAVLRLDALVRDGIALAPGYDLADAERDGWTKEQLMVLDAGLWEPVRTDPQLPIDSLQPKRERKAESKAEEKPVARKDSKLLQAHQLAAGLFNGKLAYTQNQFRAYQNGHWPVLDTKVDIEREALEFLGDAATSSKISEIVSLLSTAYAVRPTDFERPKRLICLSNGTLDPIKGELRQHNPDDYLTNALDITWSADATCPLWHQTLDEVFALDDDKTDKIRLLQEFMGYCLVPLTHMHKFLWMVGGGGNGKSVILAILTALIGKANISFAQIERLQDKFVRAELCGKLVNISSEMSAQATVSDGYLKQIVAGDVVEAERKHQPSFSFKPYSRLIGATNELPRLLDHSDGFFRRAMILTFTRQFKDEERDENREGRLMAELPGILKWAVDGLQSLLARGTFAIPQSSTDELAKYRVNSDPIRQFAEECIASSETRSDFITPAYLHQRYQEWCKMYGYQALAINKLSERLKNLQINQYRSGGSRLWQIKYTPPVEFDQGDDSAAPNRVSSMTGRYIV